ncbi:hypothetical protein [Methanosarcina barkeri]|uniref:hypothetical protein n=1 Tax=Methanosarcina barkeri TaxID=2208 RepID=UPI0006967718|nr:hypothetical protein [Methanosarcina barkeri]
MEERKTSDENGNLKDYMLKEVDLIQNVIKRMASNSFMTKGWTVTLVVATLLLKDDNSKILIAYVPLISFWYLDSYFLWQERMYRKLYNWVIENRLKTNEYLLDMNAYRFLSEVDSIVQIMFSKTLFLFYGSIFLLLTVLIIYLLINKSINEEVLKIFIFFN